jgi:hypothetical protein
MANCIVCARNLRSFQVEDDYKIKRAEAMPFFKELQHAIAGPETIEPFDRQR